MNTISTRAVRHLTVPAVIIAAMLGLAPGRALAQRDNRPPTPPGPPLAAAQARPLPAPPSSAEGAGWLGISMAEVTAEKAREARLSDIHGVVVTGVSENSPAAKAGLAGGDIILEFRGQRVEGTLELARLVRETPPGRVAKLTVWRDGRSREFSVEIGRAPGLLSGNLLPPDLQERLREFGDRLQRRLEQRRGAAAAPVLGITVQDVSGQFAAYLKVPDNQGVLVTDVQAGSAAERGGLHAGDVIIFVDSQRVRNTAELRAQIRRSNEARTVALRVIRNGAETTLSVEIGAASGPGPRAVQSRPIPI